MTLLVKNGYFTLERSGDRKELYCMFNDEYSFKIEELLDFLKLIQLDKMLWQEFTSSRGDETVQLRVPADDKAVLPWLLR